MDLSVFLLLCVFRSGYSVLECQTRHGPSGADKSCLLPFIYRGKEYIMHPLVRNLYKRIIMVGRDYPGGMDIVRRKTKEYFRKNSDLTESEDILRAVNSGRWYLKNEIIGVIQLKKYRAMKGRYYDTDTDDIKLPPLPSSNKK